MTYKVLGNVPLGGELRRYSAGVDLEVDESRAFKPTWVGHGFLPHLQGLSGTVIDYGCGSGLLGLHAAVQSAVEEVVFLDIDVEALALCKENASRNNVAFKCRFIDDVHRLQKRVDTVIANLPENMNLDFCGEDGSDLQRDVVFNHAPNLLQDGGNIVTKGISYAARWWEEPEAWKYYQIAMLETIKSGDDQAHIIGLSPKKR